LRLGKAFSALLAVILAIAILSGLIWFIIHQVIIIGRDGTEIQARFLTIFDTIQKWLHDQFGLEPTEVVERLRGQANQILSNAASYLTAAFGSLGNILAGAILVPLFSFFLLYYRVFFREFFFRVFKSTPQETVHNTLNKIYQVVQSYLL